MLLHTYKHIINNKVILDSLMLANQQRNNYQVAGRTFDKFYGQIIIDVQLWHHFTKFVNF